MQNKIISIGSMNQAIGARRILSREGIASRVVKLDTTKSAEGCGYGLSYAEEDGLDLARILRINGIRYHIYGDRE